LNLGLNEMQLSFLMSGLIGAFSYAAIAMVSLSVGRSPLFALVLPLLYFFVFWKEDVGVNYRIELFDTVNTNGSLGHALPALALGLLACGVTPLGLLSLPLAVVVHSVTGAFTTGIV